MVWQNGVQSTAVSLFSQSGSASVGAGGTDTIVSLVDISQYESYDLATAFVDTSQNTAGHALVQTVSVQFFDDLTSGIPIYQETWYPWVVSQTPTVGLQGVIGCGPVHGHYMTIKVSNGGSGAVTIPYFNLYGSPRNVQVSDWRQCHGNHVSDATLHEIQTVGDGYDNSLFDSNGLNTLANSTGYLFPLFLFAGAVDIMLDNNSAVLSSAEIVDIGAPDQTSGNISTTTGAIFIFPSTALAAAAVTFASINLPRSACALKLITTASGGGNVGFKVVAQQT
jgi:hypothetical protein